MSSRILLAALLLVAAKNARAAQPNIVLIMADDFGYECVTANGGESYRTPNLDKLAAGGVRFEHCYVQPLCTPTRVQLMTGLYNVRNYGTFGQMDAKAVTFGNVLKQAGYTTCMAGKWQLGRSLPLPKTYGFDEYCLWQHTRRPPRYANPGLEINGVEKDYKQGEYGPDLVQEYALDFISRNKAKPFFLYYPMMLTHSPFQPTPDSKDWDPAAMGEKVNDKRRHFDDMVAYTDKLVGQLVAHLEQQGLRERTLILFLGDNGTKKGVESKFKGRTYVGGKGLPQPTGMRVPLIVSWPGKASTGAVCRDLVDSTDFLPTLCEAAGVKPISPCDGRSFLPQALGEKGRPRDWIYCWYSPRGEEPAEFVADAHYRLDRGGRLSTIDEWGQITAVAPDSAAPEAQAARVKFEKALAQFEHARPDELKKITTGKRRSRRAADD